jgi:hypothetical protein
MKEQMSHRDVATLVSSLADAKILNLDASIRTLVQPMSASLGKLDPGGKASLHILCCNEYALVTGITAGSIGEVTGQAGSVRSSLSEG